VTISFWQLWLMILTGAGILFIGALFGAWAVFRTKNAQLGIPFMQQPQLKKDPPHSYVSELFGEEETEEEEISEAAKRLRAQKGSSSVVSDMMEAVTGKAGTK